MNYTKLYSAVALALFVCNANANTYAQWLTQIGETDAIMATSNGGKGVTIGVIDSGVSATNFAFTKGQVTGANDVQNHGTAVAAIAAGNSPARMNVNYGGYSTQVGNQISVSPNASIYSYQAVNALGVGSNLAVANGIIAAANANVSVINLSLSFTTTPDINVINAMNYAASKGAIIVWAAGNSNINYLNNVNMVGLTSKTISQILFVGSVNSTGNKSTFSNVPGKGSMGNVTYASRWITAPGENILAPYNIASMPTFATSLLWTGTSMSAPIVSGSIALLDSTWKVLQTQGTSANLLLATEKNGQVNLTTAFAPVGNLTVLQSNGTMAPVSSLTGVMLNNGVLGNLSSIKSTLSNYTAFDGYNRNFSVDLSKLIVSSSTNTASVSTSSVTKLPTTKYADSFVSDGINRFFVSNGDSYYNHNVVFFNDENTYNRHSYLDTNVNMFSLTDSSHAKVVAMSGMIDEDDRYKVAIKNNLNILSSQLGVNHNLTNDLSVTVNMEGMIEDRTFLGNNMGSLFNVTKSSSQGIQTSLSYKLNQNMGVSVQHDRMWSTGSNMNAISESFGVSMNIGELVLGVKQPLHIVSGTTSMAVGYADPITGIPSVKMQSVSLRPDVIETDIHMGYTTELNHDQFVSVQFDYMQNYMNTINTNASIGINWSMRF
jgi:hypothetical protein